MALLWAAGDQPHRDLPDAAAEMLANGSDSPSLRELAGAPPDDYWQVKWLFERTLHELGIPVLDEQDALWALARQVAQEIVDGDRSPTDGATWIWRHLSHRLAEEGDLRIFAGLASSFEDHPGDGAALAAIILEEAAELLTRAEPRTWVRVQARSDTAPVTRSATRAPVNLRDLDITHDVVRALEEWAARHDALFDPEAGEGGFADEDDAQAFVERGRQLVTRLQAQLGDRWHVEYVPEPTAPPGLRLRAGRA